MKRKTILLIGNYPPPFGGVPRHIEYLAPYLVEKGWEVHILSGGSSGVEYKNGFTVYKPGRKLKICSLIDFLFKQKKAWMIKFKSKLRDSSSDWLRYMVHISLGMQIIEKNGISIISAYNLYTYAPIGAVLSEEYDIPLVVTNFGEIYSMRDFFEKNTGLVEYVSHIAKRLLAMSRHCAESYKLLGLSPTVEVIPYGVDIVKFSPINSGDAIRNKLDIDPADKVILFVGRLIKDMGLHTVLDAIPFVLKVNNRIKFIIVGEKGELLFAALKLAEKYRRNLFVIPNVPFEELPFYYAGSDIVIAPTLGDRACGSLAAIEAMATGKPVIASKVGGIPEIVIDKETGLLIPPQEPAALSEAILNLIKDEALAQTMGKRGRQRVEKFFDENKIGQKIEQLFSQLAEA